MTKRYIDVQEALKIREKNGGEYRENPCYHEQYSYENGYGISLFPRRESKDGKRAHFARYSDRSNEMAERKLAKIMGVKPTTGIYRNNVLRLSTMIRNIRIALQNDLSETMDIAGHIDRTRDSDEDIASHDFEVFIDTPGKPGYKSKIKLFVMEKGRQLDIGNSISNWVLEITKWETDIVMHWEKGESLFLEEWSAFRKRYEKTRINERKRRVFSKDKLEKVCLVIAERPDSAELNAKISWQAMFRAVFSGPDPSELRSVLELNVNDQNRRTHSFSWDYERDNWEKESRIKSSITVNNIGEVWIASQNAEKWQRRM